MKRVTLAVVVLALVLGSSFVVSPKKASALLTAAEVCWLRQPEPNMTHLYADFTTMTPDWLYTACWRGRSNGSATVTYNVMYWSDSHIGPAQNVVWHYN